MPIPQLDPRVKYVGASYLRQLNVERLRLLAGAVVVQDIDAEPLAVIVPFETWQDVQARLNQLSTAVIALERPVDQSSSEDKRPQNCSCKHCGQRFAGVKYTNICGECKSSGHTLDPRECPRCTEASAL